MTRGERPAPPDTGSGAGALRRRAQRAAVHHAGRLLPPSLLEQMRDFANYALGSGSAMLAVETSGEAAFLERLAGIWAGHDRPVVIVDVGAHHGTYTEAALEAFGGRARIECFEPDPANYEALTARVGTKAGCHPVALSDEPRTAPLFRSSGGGVLSSLHPDVSAAAGVGEPSSIEVEVDTLDRFAQRLGIERINLLKVDVEGHELAVLRGAAGLLGERRIDAIQFEFGERNLASRTYLRDFHELLDQHQLFRLSPHGLTPLGYTAADEVFLLEANYVAADPDLSRLFTARSSRRRG